MSWKCKRWFFVKCFTVVIVLGLLSMYYFLAKELKTVVLGRQNGSQERLNNVHVHDKGLESVVRSPQRNSPHLALVVCGERYDQAVTMLTSAVLFTRTHLTIHIIAENGPQERLKSELDSWPPYMRKRMTYIVYNVSYPADVEYEQCAGLEWKPMYRPCSTQRLFFGDMLTDVDTVLYVDTDALFLAPIEELWSFLDKFNSTQFVAAASNHGLLNGGIYHRRNISFYGPSGINSGILLMNLTRLRKSSWVTTIPQYLIKYGKELTYADQDLINLYMNYHPEHAYLLPCEWNFHPSHCYNCSQAARTGAALLHGFDKAFENDKIPPFRAIYKAFRQFNVTSPNPEQDLLQKMKNNIMRDLTREEKKLHVCQKDPWVYTTRMERLISR